MEVGTAFLFMPRLASPKSNQYPHGYPLPQRRTVTEESRFSDVVNVANRTREMLAFFYLLYARDLNDPAGVAESAGTLRQRRGAAVCELRNGMKSGRRASAQRRWRHGMSRLGNHPSRSRQTASTRVRA